MIHNVLTLNNGIEIPQLGLGTWFIRDDIVADAIKEAVNIGYRHFDTAQAYETSVESVKESGTVVFQEMKYL